MIGRQDVVEAVSADLRSNRFITIIGPGGMGKTTVAVAIAHALHEHFDGAVAFIDFATVAKPALVEATLASSLGVVTQTDDALPALVEHLTSRRMLLVLDNCEHVIDAVAVLAETVFQEAPNVHLLATSREAMRIEGEHVYWLPALPGPPAGSDRHADLVFSSPAAQLFLERAAAGGGHVEPSEDNAPIVAAICARLEGVPLAIELAAGRAGSHGIVATADLLSRSLGLDWQGRRTALPRHQTIRALLDWSYAFLPEDQQLALRRLSVFVGAFTTDAAASILGEDHAHGGEALYAIDDLVAKSLLSARAGSDGSTHYSLLETTRAYGLEKLHECGEADSVMRRHARYFITLLDSRHGGQIDLEYTGRAYALREHLGNLRAGLEWCFSNQSDPINRQLAVHFAAAATPVFFELSLLSEAYTWSGAALGILDEATSGGRREMLLRSTWAISSLWIGGSGDDVLTAITRGMELAQPVNEPSQHLRMLATRHVYLTRVADFRGALAAARDWEGIARAINDDTCLAISDLMHGVAHHFLGDQALAKRKIDAGFLRAGARNLQLCGNDHRVRGMITQSRVLWLLGLPEQAMATARRAADAAEDGGKPVDRCFALLYTAPVYLWCGRWEAAEGTLDQLMGHSHWHLMKPFHPIALTMRGASLIGQGDAEGGTAQLLVALRMMEEQRQNVIGTFLACWIAEGLTAIGRAGEAFPILRGARLRALRGSERVHLPELLRQQAEALLAASNENHPMARRLLLRSCRLARQQSALSWELRSALALARISDERSRSRQIATVSSIYERFTEGFDTQDLQSAERLLREAGRRRDGRNRLAVDPDRQ